MYVCVCMYVFERGESCVSKKSLIHLSVFVCVCMYVSHVCVCMCVYVCVYVYVCMCVYVSMYVCEREVTQTCVRRVSCM